MLTGRGEFLQLVEMEAEGVDGGGFALKGKQESVMCWVERIGRQLAVWLSCSSGSLPMRGS